MKKIIILSIFISYVCLIQGQVETTFYSSGNALDKIKNIVDQHSADKIKQFTSFDIQKYIDKDKQNKG